MENNNFEIVKEKILTQNYDEALFLLLKTKKTEINSIDYYFHLGKIYFYKKSFLLAKKQFEKILSKISRNDNIYLYSLIYLLTIYISKKNFKSAFNLYTKFKKLNKKHYEIISNNISPIFQENSDSLISINKKLLLYKKYHIFILKRDKELIQSKISINILNLLSSNNNTNNINNVLLILKKYAAYLEKEKKEKILNIIKSEKALKELQEKEIGREEIKKTINKYKNNKKYIPQEERIKIEKKISLIIEQYILEENNSNNTGEIFRKLKNLKSNYNTYKNFIPKQDLDSFKNVISEKVVKAMNFFNISSNYNKTIKIYNLYNNFISRRQKFLYNKFLNEFEIAAGKTVLKSKPRKILFELTNSCNLKCIMCYQKKDMIYNISKRAFSFLKYLLPYLELIMWQGGEILNIEYFKKILLKVCSNKKILNRITSNFQNVSDDMIEIISRNNINLTISVDGAKKQTYEKIRIGGKFNKLITNIKKLNLYKKKYSNTNALILNFVILKQNYKEILDIVYFAKKYKFNAIVYLNCYTNKTFVKMNDSETKKAIILLKKAKEIANKFNIEFVDLYSENNKNRFSDKKNNTIDLKSNFNYNNLEKGNTDCFLPWISVTFFYENSFAPDTSCVIRSYNKIEQYRNFNSLWNSIYMQDIRRKVTKSKCNSCTLLEDQIKKI